MKRILVPTDFSPQADNALKVAAMLAEKNDAEIYLEHSLDLPGTLAISGPSSAKPQSIYFIKLAEQKFEEVLKRDYLFDVEVHTAIGHGEIYDDVQLTVKDKDIDLIVMGSHGTSGFKELFIGSNAEKVVRTSEIPVLVVKNEHTTFDIKDFVFATDFTEECRKPFDQAQKFAKAVGAKLHLLYVNTPNDFKTTTDINKTIDSFVRGMGAENYTKNIYCETSVEKGILSFAKEINAQLIGMSTHGRQGLSHFFNGSISEDLVNHANMPVITFKI
ncbi:universal stress protein [Marinirhabdus gelatinilytica]|uniref:Nucleotide-binding universal stress UspA family protein n=1 Tax=Marinirhabdus gelatinilytica TaxID=1703343 RepID=A0A370QK58_9FLAO|nr:universal stress protein [Marinirhabdus gelatinilytica]RDK88758.1 nucleotide-binding universal stress UspA family protein [Marinirhabdus gelatinilytica]